MAFVLTDNLRQGLQKSDVKTTLVLKIDGYDTLFGNVQIKKYVQIGDPGLLIGSDWVIGGFNLISNQSPYVTFNTGNTTTKITQKLDPSKGLGSSVSQMAVTLLDFNQEMVKLVSPNFELEEIMGRFCTVYLGIEESAWPEDYNPVFKGIVQNIDVGTTYVTLYLNNTEEKKRAQIQPLIETELTSRVNYRSAVFQDLFFKNRPDRVENLTITYIGGGVAGSEVVTVLGSTIQVQIQNAVSTASQIKKAIENHPDASQLVEVTIEGDSSDTQVTGSQALLIDTIINVIDTTKFQLPADAGSFNTFVKIDDELLGYTGKTLTSLTGVTRGQLNTEPDVHKVEADVTQIIQTIGNPIDLALKYMLSGGASPFAFNLDVASFVYMDPSTLVDNAVFFTGVDVAMEHGVSKNSLVSFTGSINPANDLIDAVVSEVGSFPGGSYIIINQTLTPELESTALASFKTIYNVWPIGLKMLPREVDITQHEFIRDTFLPTSELDIFFDEIPNGKDFLEREVYLPVTCFSVPRKGQSSIVIHVAPLPTYNVIQLNRQTVENPEALTVQRSLNENFFNSVVYNYNYAPTNNSFLTTLQMDSTLVSNFIKDQIGLRTLTINSKGLRSTSAGETIIDIASRRFLKRYERGAEFIKGIKLHIRTGYEVEIGDIVAADFADLQLADFTTGNRSGTIKLMEVLNKILDNKTGEVSIDVVNTIFGVNDRFGLISPASISASGSTTSKVMLQKSYGTKAFERESAKYSGYIGQPVIVRNQNFTQVYDTFIRGFDNNNPQGMSIDPIAVAPGTDWIVEAPNYPVINDVTVNAFWKQRHAFFSPQVVVQNAIAISQTEFEVDPADIGKFKVNAVVRVHNYTYTDDGPEATVTDVDTLTNIVTINTATGFPINDSHFVDLIGFADGGAAYRII